MEVAGDAVLGLEDALTTEEVPTPVVTLDSENCQKLSDLPNPKVSTARADVKSAYME